MRSRNLVSVLPVLVASLALGAFAGCAAPASEASDDQSQDVTGGSSSIESPVAFLFEATSAAADSPKCAGAMLSDTMAVTAKACAKEGLVVGRAADKDGRGERAKVKAVHLPTEADADIAVVELDKPLKGTNAVITHMPLRAGYAVNAFAATGGTGLFSALSPDKNDASTVKGTMTEESATHGSITPEKGSTICDGDIGAPVCSTTSFKVPIAHYNVYGTCGLSGLVVSRMATPATPADPKAAPKAAETAGCSAGAWKVTQLGQHRDFLAKFAPKAFQPIVIDKPILRLLPGYAPEGLWGYKSKGDIKKCTLDTTKLDGVEPRAISGKLRATVSFAAMDAKATPFGRFGIALKNDPTKIRWMPAQRLDSATGAAFESKFEGVVSADVAGDYIVVFRASANGGESWTTCDTDGIENGYAADKSIPLTIADAVPTPPPAGSEPPPPSTTPQGETPTTPSDPAPQDGETVSDGSKENGSSDPLPDFSPKKKGDSGSDGGGCSMSSSSMSSSLPIVGVLLGLVAMGRRRRQS